MTNLAGLRHREDSCSHNPLGPATQDSIHLSLFVSLKGFSLCFTII